MPIPFIRKYPKGKGAIQDIKRPAEIENIAFQFLGAGGWYTIEIQMDGLVKLSATDEELKDLVSCVSSNGPFMGIMIDQLVRQSKNHVAALLETASTAVKQ